MLMADEAAVTEGTAPTTAATPAWSRADTLKALEANEHVAAKPAEAAPVAEPASEPDAEVESAADAEPDVDEAEEPEADEDAPSEVAAAPDADLDKRLAKVQAAERRAREQLQRERQAATIELTKLREEVQSDIDAARQFVKLRESGRYDLTPILELLGIQSGDYMHHARILAAAAPENKDDPKSKDVRQRLTEQRRVTDELAATKKRLDEMEAAQRADVQRAENQRQTEAYLDAVVAVKADAPLARAALKADPKTTRLELAQVALELLEQSGDPPDHAEVLKTYEARETARLKRLGVSLPVKAASAPVVEEKPAASGKKPAAKKADAKPKAAPPANETQAQRRERIRLELEAGELNFD